MKNLLILAAILLSLPQSILAQDSPKAKKLLEWGWDEPDTEFMRQNIEKMEQLPFDGLLDASTPQTRIADVWEGAYTYKKREQFENAYKNIKMSLAALAADPDKYRRRIEAGFGIWMDCEWRRAGWRTDGFSKNHFTPAEFEKSVRAALEVSDEYVWVYTEQPKWWTNERLPKEYVEALGNARKPAVLSRPAIPSVKELAARLPCSVDYFDVAGHPAFLIRPKGKAGPSPLPWVWYAPVIGHPNPSHAWMLRQWLDKGIGMAGVDVGESSGSPAGRKIFTALWETMTSHYGMSKRPCLLPQSRGGLMLYNWAAENPTRVACIAGIYTVCDLRSYPGLERACGAYNRSAAELEARLAEHNPIDRLAPLAKAGVPILHVHGDADTVVPLEKNSGELARRYRALGGQARLIVVRGKGHQVCDEFFHCQELVDFVIAQALQGGPCRFLPAPCAI